MMPTIPTVRCSNNRNDVGECVLCMILLLLLSFVSGHCATSYASAYGQKDKHIIKSKFENGNSDVRVFITFIWMCVCVCVIANRLYC